MIEIAVITILLMITAHLALQNYCLRLENRRLEANALDDENLIDRLFAQREDFVHRLLKYRSSPVGLMEESLDRDLLVDGVSCLICGHKIQQDRDSRPEDNERQAD